MSYNPWGGKELDTAEVTWHTTRLKASLGVVPFIHSSIHSLIHSFIHSLTYSFTHSFIHSFIHSLTYSFTHSFIRVFIHSPNRSVSVLGAARMRQTRP